MKIIQEVNMPLLSRKRVTLLEEVSGSTPSKALIKKKLSEIFKVDENVISLRHIYQQYGKPVAKIIAHIYDNESSLNKIEPIKNGKKTSKKQKTK